VIAADLLTISDTTIGYGRKVVMSDVNLTIERGTFTGLLGANGTGKSTLIKTILGIIPPLQGRVDFGLVNGKSAALGYVPQRDSLDSIYLLSSFEVVLMGTCGRVGAGSRISSTEKQWADQCLHDTGADSLRRKLFSELSGGQKQRVLIARALAARPDFLLLDEPTAGIDLAARTAIMHVLKTIHAQQKLTILMASHDLTMVRANVGRVIWLHHGSILHGPVSELLNREKLTEILDLELS
jgi:ABC-type Mn2+/Zn2+ transport system ATPase subunit